MNAAIVIGASLGVILAFALIGVENAIKRYLARRAALKANATYEAFVAKYRTRPGWFLDLTSLMWVNPATGAKQSEEEWVAEVDNSPA